MRSSQPATVVNAEHAMKDGHSDVRKMAEELPPGTLLRVMGEEKSPEGVSQTIVARNEAVAEPIGWVRCDAPMEPPPARGKSAAEPIAEPPPAE